jgi:transcriptional regulator with XRE-family HTH domain
MGKLKPNLRLKALRKELNISQAKLAERSGVSYPYLLSVEIGQRALSLPLAETISCATGIGPMWLLGREGKISQPLTPTGRPYTLEYYVSAFEQHKEALKEINPDEQAEIGRQSRKLRAFMQAACRKRRFPLAIYFFDKMLTDSVKNLGLDHAYKVESARVTSVTHQRPAVLPMFNKPKRLITFDD